MPGDDEEDIVMTSTQCPLLNMTCPLSGKPVTELADPVRRYNGCLLFFPLNLDVLFCSGDLLVLSHA